MMSRLLAVSLVSMATLAAQPAVHSPQVGFVTIADGTLRPVYGVAGNFILGPAAAGQILSQAFSGSMGLLKTASKLTAFDAQGHALATTDAPPGPALFAFSADGATALAYMANSNTFVEWSGGQFKAVPFRTAADTVVAIAMPSEFEASVIVQRDDGLWDVRIPFTHRRPESQQALPGVTAPVIALASGALLYSDAQGLVLRKPDHSEIRIAAQLPVSFSLAQMKADWVQLTDANSGRRFAIRITAGHEGFYQLPEAGQ